MDSLADIRPYNDTEVRPVLDRLLRDPECLISVARLRHPVLARRAPGVLVPLVRWQLRRQLAGVRTVRDLQAVVKKYMDRMIESTTGAFTVSGLEALSPDEAYLFMSNHRDIALDPAFVNYALYHNGHDTVRIAIGDNLLSKPFAADLMRLNKSFIVRRSAKGPRQVLAAYRQLSGYIRHSIVEERCPIWLAQREGRAKDGRDRTEPAIVKMLAMSQNKTEQSLTDYLATLRLVPVAISYEWDPCDGAKARELYEVAERGAYRKAEHEDLASIALGITGDKGAVHVAFGTPLQGEFEDADAVAAAVDEQIWGRYVLHPTNFIAWQRLHGAWPDLSWGARSEKFDPDAHAAVQQQFDARIAALPEPHRPYALALYANPVASRLKLAERGVADPAPVSPRAAGEVATGSSN